MPRSRLYSLLLPPGLSLAIHAGLLAVIAAVSITAIRLTDAVRSTGDVVITLDNLAPLAEAPSPSAAESTPADALTPASLPSADSPSSTDLAPPPITLSPTIAPSPAPSPATTTAFRRAPTQGAAFAGLSASRVRRVVYVVDISGPMTASLSFVLDELRRSVSRLDPSQHFQVILFRQDLGSPTDPGALWLSAPSGAASPQGSPPRLMPATAANRAALAEFLAGVRPSGRSNPLAGLRLALALQPDAIFLLAQGISRTGPNARWGEGNATILQELNTLNPEHSGRRRTAIKTVQFVEDDPTGLMQAIALAHGGSEDSYTRRNVDDLRAAADAPLPIEAPDTDLDRAASLLSDLNASRADLRVLFGGGGDDDRTAVRRATAQVLELLASREQSPSADELTRLVLARALTLRAAASSGPDAGSTQAAPPGAREFRPALLDRAITLLDTSDGAPPEVLSTAAAARALRQSPGDLRESEALARRAADANPSTMAALEARLSATAATAGDPARCDPWVAELSASVSRPPFIVAGRLDAPLALLALDAAARARVRHAATPADIDAALAQHLALAREPLPGLPGEAVLLAAGALVPSDAPLDQIDPDLALARGLALLPPPGQAPPAEAIAALDLAVLRAAPGSDTAETARVRAAMAISLGVVTAAQPQPGGGPVQADLTIAIDRLDRVLEDFPNRSWRRDAALHLLSHTGAALDQLPTGTDAPVTDASDRILASRRRALHVLVVEISRPEPRADAWRLELAHRTAQADAGDGAMLDQAADLLSGPWADRPAEADRLEAWARSERVAQLAAELSAAQHARSGTRARALAADLAAAARAAIPVAARISPEAADALRTDLAEALILSGSPEAAEIYADLRERGATLGRSPAFLALGHARALLAQGDDAGAFAILRDLTASMPEPPADGGTGGDGPTDATSPTTFWHAWTLTIEILADRAATVADEQPRRAAAAHLLRLHDLDPALGGEPWASRLHAAALSLGVALGDEGAPADTLAP